jgi:hypothetical protein
LIWRNALALLNKHLTGVFARFFGIDRKENHNETYSPYCCLGDLWLVGRLR